MTEKLTSWFNLPTFEMIFVSDAILPLLSAALFRDVMRVYTATERISAEKKHIFLFSPSLCYLLRPSYYSKTPAI